MSVLQQWVLFLCVLHMFWCGVMAVRFKEDVKRNSPIVAFFHPGPGKTGTTHLQSFLVSAEDALLKENFAIWPDLYPAFLTCKRDGSLSNADSMLTFRGKQLSVYYKYFGKCKAIRNAVHSFIRKSAKLNRNIIFSSETFLASEAGVRSIMDVLKAENYIIHGVISYRFSLNWFISRYNEEVTFQSISSAEMLNPKAQLGKSLFSEYLVNNWVYMFKRHKIQAFYDILSSYASYRFSVIDLYGTVAAGKELTEVFLCNVANVLCGNSKFEELKQLRLHQSESAINITERQMNFVFNEYAGTSNCTMDFSHKGSAARKFLVATMLKHRWKERIPVRLVNISAYAQNSLLIDEDLRGRFGKYFINGDPAANFKKINPLPIVVEVDRNIVTKGHWLVKMKSRLQIARKKKLCYMYN